MFYKIILFSFLFIFTLFVSAKENGKEQGIHRKPAGAYLNSMCVSADGKFKIEIEYGSDFFWLTNDVRYTAEGISQSLPVSSVKQYKNDGEYLFIELDADNLKWAYRIEAKKDKGVLVGRIKGNQTPEISLKCKMSFQ
ncbi:MAG: hypothetical protein ACXVCE_16245 [Bacteriovorax sp.]